MAIRKDPSFRAFHRECVFRGQRVTVTRDQLRLPNSVEVVHETIHLPDAVAIVPLLGQEDPRVVLVEQFRTALEGYIHELPAGVIEEGEDPESCARRELEEETGYRAEDWRLVGSFFQVPGTSNHRIHIFVARDLKAGKQALEETECLRVKTFSLRELTEALPERSEDLSVLDAKTHLGLLYASRLLATEAGP